MVRLLRVALVIAVLFPAAVTFTMLSQVPSSAYVVPTVQIATAGEPIRLTPQALGARRTARGLEVDPRRLEDAVASLAETFALPPEPGSYELNGSGVILKEGVAGWELDREAAKALLMDALRGRARNVALPVREVAPEQAPEKAVVVRLSEFRLELYEHAELVKHYEVGVGKLDFPTPPGVYYVRSKATNPTWRNPGSRWARGMPAYIPPGPRNPLGTRALRLDRDAIVIHGTPNPGSVGQRSSHGCVRMRRAEVEELFELVPEGTPVFIVP